MKSLLIVESPSKAKTIEKYLGHQYIVRASVGHIRDLPTSNKKAIDIENGFIPYYEISKGKEKIVKELQHLAIGVEEILLATDPDREGEAISYHIDALLKQEKKITAPIQRVTFNEITKEAIIEALKHPRIIDQHLVKAQEARRVLDRLVGYDLSGIIWKKVRYGLSAGRVQSPALRIIMEKEREIRTFIKETYFTLEAKIETEKKTMLVLSCNENPKTKERVDEILQLSKGSWAITDIKETKQKRSARAPFTTSTLQQTASTRLGYSPSRTMQIAQKLYEQGAITYMRTDSTTLSGAAIGEISKIIETTYGKEYIEIKQYKTKSKNAQEAHEAIRPTHALKTHAGVTEEQERLYKLIWERTVSSQMIQAEILRTKIESTISEEKDFPIFSINGSRILSLGWLACDTGARGEDVELPKVTLNEKVRLLSLDSEEKETQPPNRYSEAGLIKELEERGIGRPSTYASIIKTIEDRGYVTKEGRTLFPTDTGDVVSTFLEQYFMNYISDTFTADIENQLDDIANGERDYKKTLQDFYTPFTTELQEKDTIGKITNLGDAPKEHVCPLCKKEMIIKLGKNGKFLSCATYPDCSGARTFEGKELEGPKDLGKPCPKCGLDKNGQLKKETKSSGGKLVLREGRFGAFISCSLYPKCKYIEEDEEEAKKKDTGVLCTMCKKAHMIERRGKFGIFYSCKNYPDCKNAIKAKPTGNICTMCNSLMMEGTKTIPERCSNNKCLNHRPDKISK